MRNRHRLLFFSLICAVSMLWGCNISARPKAAGTARQEDAGTAVLSENDEKEPTLSPEEIYEKGYDLPIDMIEKKESEADCLKIMELLRECYKENGGKEEAVDMYDILSASGFPVTISGEKIGMGNYKKMETFLENSSQGKNGDIVLYKVRPGGIVRQKLIFDGRDMYSLHTVGGWNREAQPSVKSTEYTRIKAWEYTDKGWFHFVYCVPEPPEVTELISGNVMLRVKPFNKKYQDLAEKYLTPVNYQANNLFCSNWDADHLEDLDFTALFEGFYLLEYKERLSPEQYLDGIPEEEFETLMTKYLPVSGEQLKEYASYEPEGQVYNWYMVGSANYVPMSLAASYPEIIKLEDHGNGLLTLTVDAVSEASELSGSDKEMTHEVTVRLWEDGSIEYCSNLVLLDVGEKLPEYRFRIPR